MSDAGNITTDDMPFYVDGNDWAVSVHHTHGTKWINGVKWIWPDITVNGPFDDERFGVSPMQPDEAEKFAAALVEAARIAREHVETA